MDDNGGSVFPNTNIIGDNRGLSLRDYFAVMAPRPDPIKLRGAVDEEQEEAILQAAARNAYRWADAMLKAREDAR